MGRPPNHAASRAPSMASATLPDSRRAISLSDGSRLTAASAITIPVIATTTRISRRVNPLFPVADVSRIAFSAARLVGAEAEDVDLALHAGIEVLVVAAPRVLGQALEIAALLPVVGRGVGGGPLHQRHEPLLGGGVRSVVEAIELQRLHDRADVRLRGDPLRLV